MGRSKSDRPPGEPTVDVLIDAVRLGGFKGVLVNIQEAAMVLGKNVGLLILVSTLAAASLSAQPAVNTDQLEIRRNRVTGLASFIRAKDGGAIPVEPAQAAAAPGPDDFLRSYGPLFGVTDAANQLVREKTNRDDIGYTHSSFRQFHNGVPVFGGVVRVHQDKSGAIRSGSGDFFPIPAALNPVPTRSAKDAVAAANKRLNLPASTVEQNDLIIVDPGWYGDPPAGVHLAYQLILSDRAAGVREAFFIDAHTGKILDQWNLLETAKIRSVFDDVLNVVVRSEGGAATGDFEADGAYDWSGDTYDYLFRAFNRNGIDGAGGVLGSTVHLQDPSCPNAFGGGGSAFFCDGIVTDDIVAHEFAHSLTEDTANFIYQNQSGQLNESFSDILGEIVDFLNGDVSAAGPPGGTPWPPSGSGPGTDTPNTLRTTCVGGAFMTVNSPAGIAGDYSGQPASFGPSLTGVGTSGDVVVANPVRGCDLDLPFTNAATMNGKIVLMDRGDCNFTEKVLNAQDEGAIAVIIANNVAGGPAPMGGFDPAVIIPSLGLTQADGTVVKNANLTDTVNVTLRANTSADVRWLVGEDSAGFGGAIRDMWQPSCMGDPDTANHPFQTCAAEDNGGVHSGSGVPNHAFAMLTDGKVFNSQTVTGIGLFKAGAVWYRALTTYMGPTDDFGDAYAALNQAAADLVGENIRDPRDGSIFGVFTNADAVEVNDALLATEMNTTGRCGANEVLSAVIPEPCSTQSMIYTDHFTAGNPNGWSVSVTGPTGPPTPYNWVLRNTGLPAGLTGTAWFGEDRNVGDCAGQDESAVHSLTTPVIALPATVDGLTLGFTHYVETEAGYDGGNVKISVNGGAFQLIPTSAYTYNPYNTTLFTTGDGNTNPMAGQSAFTGGSPSGNNSGRSLIDLSSLAVGGNTVRFQFDFGKDGCGGVTGWFMDDFDLYQCPAATGAPAITWNSDPNATTRATRSMTFSVAAVTATPGQAAIAVRPLDLQNPNPANPPCCPPPNFSAYEVATCTAPGESGSCIRWVGPVQVFNESQDNPSLGTFRAARLQCSPYYTDWSAHGTFSVVGAEVVPSSSYEVRTYAPTCKGVESTCPDLGPAVTISTRRSGDVASPWNPPSAGTQPDPQDVVAVLNRFRNQPGAPGKTSTRVQPNHVDLNVDTAALDIVGTIDAFRGLAYPFSGPCSCPSSVVCNATPCTSPTPCGGGLCVRTCSGGTNDGLPCQADANCPGGGTCPIGGFCRDRCARCRTP